MNESLVPLVTPESDPHHHVVGRDLMGWSIKNGVAARYLCVSQDRCGYNLVNRSDPEDTKNVSDAVVGRTFHVIRDMGRGIEVSAWGRVTINRDGNVIRPETPVADEQTMLVAHGWNGKTDFDLADAHPMKTVDAPSPFYKGEPSVH